MARKMFEFVPDKQGIDRVLDGPGVGRLLNERAEDAADKMRSIAPRGFMGFAKTIGVRRASRTADGLEAAVGSDSPVWHLQEFGTRHTAPRATIRKAMRLTKGIRFEEGKQ